METTIKTNTAASDSVSVFNAALNTWDSITRSVDSKYQAIEKELDADMKKYTEQYDKATTAEERKEFEGYKNDILKDKIELLKQKDNAVLKRLCAVAGTGTVVCVASYTVKCIMEHKKSA